MNSDLPYVRSGILRDQDSTGQARLSQFVRRVKYMHDWLDDMNAIGLYDGLSVLELTTSQILYTNNSPEALKDSKSCETAMLISFLTLSDLLVGYETDLRDSGLNCNRSNHLPTLKTPRYDHSQRLVLSIYFIFSLFSSTYDHRLKRTGYPVRSGIHKLEIG